MVAISKKKPNTTKTKKPKKISWEVFQRKYLTREDGYKYEWLDGIVEKTTHAMNKNQLYIVDNLINFFQTIKVKFSIKGSLLAEGDTFFGGNHRRPDIAFYTRKQLIEAANDANIVPLFVIEIVSANDQMNYMHKKMQDYRAAEVAVAWHIFPELQEVHVYTDKLNKMEVLKAKQICSAEVIIKGFKIAVKDIFKK